jgi:hypothetical protein
MTVIAFIGVGLVLCGFGWYVVQKRRLRTEGPVSSRWLHDHHYSRNGDDRQAK